MDGSRRLPPVEHRSEAKQSCHEHRLTADHAAVRRVLRPEADPHRRGV